MRASLGGVLERGNTIDMALNTPANSTLAGASAVLDLYLDGNMIPLATATGASLLHNVAAAGRYRIKAHVPALQGTNLRFKGGTDHINLGNPSSLQITGSQTIEFWIKPDDFNTRQNPTPKLTGVKEPLPARPMVS